MDTYSLLEEAISSRKQVVARYDGEIREFCPHALGTKRGGKHVLVYQFGGASGSGLPPGGEWLCLRVDELSDPMLRDGEWHTAPNVFNPQSCFDEIDVVVQGLPARRRGGSEAERP